MLPETSTRNTRLAGGNALLRISLALMLMLDLLVSVIKNYMIYSVTLLKNG